MSQELLIQNGSVVYAPVTQDEIVWTTERKGSPGKLEFKVLKDDVLKFEEGNPVSFKVDGNNVFYGFVFTKKREKEKIIKVTTYDQLRYLKNKSSYVYTNKRADELVKMIANDFLLNVGTLENTNYKIAKKSESNQSLFDIILNALDETIQYKKEMYVLYDDFGKICLKNLERMKVGIIIDEETAQNYDYQSSIDTDTYNKVKLVYDNEETGKREVYIAQDTNNMNNWGVLQYFDTIDEKTNGAVKAKTLLNLYNQKTRSLEIKKAIGDIRVRGGSLIIVNLDLGDVKLQHFMLVEKAKHTFKNRRTFYGFDIKRSGFYNAIRRGKMASLVDAIKKISQGVEEASAPCNVLYGIVTSINPLEITIEQKLKLTSEFLVLTKNVTDYSVDVSIDWDTESKSLNANHSHSANANVSVNSSISPNPDSQTINNNVETNIEINETKIGLSHAHSITGTKRMTIHNALKKNDTVILIQKRGGQEYIVLDKI